MRKLVSRLIAQSKKATPWQLADLVNLAKTAPFAGNLLEADEPLWGGFWQGDVISPGYRLPAIELALLRAVRLDLTWPEGTGIPQFVANLRQAISDPQAGIWALAVAGEPCIVFASAGGQPPEIRGQASETGGSLATVAWYCLTTGQLHAGYRVMIDQLNFAGAVEQRPLQYLEPTYLKSASPLPLDQPTWLDHMVEQAKTSSGHPLATRLDAEILQLRAQMRK